MTEKSLGQVLVDKLRELPGLRFTSLLPWQEQPESIQRDWQAAAEAVVAARDHRADDALKHWLGEIQKQLDWIKRSNPGTDAERAVVEAAVAWHDSGEHVCGVALSEAIEALQEERGR